MSTFTELLAQLETAVRAGDRARALELARVIQQQLVQAGQERAAVERQVRALLAELEAAQTAGKDLKRLEWDIRTLRDGNKAMPGDAVHPRNAAQDEDIVYPVWFGTNRRQEADGSFGARRSSQTTRGRVDVFVPEAHRFGEIGTPFWKKLLRRDLRDDTLRIQGTATQSHQAWLEELRQTLRDAAAAGDETHALVFIHGFNVTFEEAAIRAAQIGVDLDVPGATAFFSWPSRGNVIDYPVDEACIEASERAITDFLVDFAAEVGARKLHLIAHSMGNRGLLRALQRIAANAQTRGKVKFDQIFLAAPDVDRDLFLDLAALYGEHAARTTLYASDADLPVHVSSELHQAARAGYFEPYTVAQGVDTIAVPDFDLDLLGHSYFAQAESLLYHMRELMLHGKAKVTASRLKPATDVSGATFWKLRR
ncbi:alpha/beta hydrolase [Lysobacter brunescens]|uniref:Alpha/beta hydrolase n=1 Tax=Lysobacter brunescens TaxID=262323 RepID=A0ABW2YC23_9GAMM